MGQIGRDQNNGFIARHSAPGQCESPAFLELICRNAATFWTGRNDRLLEDAGHRWVSSSAHVLIKAGQFLKQTLTNFGLGNKRASTFAFDD